jgi:hypothetical protein
MRLAAALLMAGILASPALAQPAPPGAPDARRQGQNWNMGQDLSHHENTGRPAGQMSEAARRAQIQGQQQRAITGTGRPVSQMPQPTPGSRPVGTPPPR